MPCRLIGALSERSGLSGHACPASLTWRRRPLPALEAVPGELWFKVEKQFRSPRGCARVSGPSLPSKWVNFYNAVPNSEPVLNRVSSLVRLCDIVNSGSGGTLSPVIVNDDGRTGRSGIQQLHLSGLPMHRFQQSFSGPTYASEIWIPWYGL